MLGSLFAFVLFYFQPQSLVPAVSQLEYRFGAVYTPLAEFEKSLLRAMDLIGKRIFPDYSPVDMLEGVVQRGPGPLVWEADVHEGNQWVLCPPSSVSKTGASGNRTDLSGQIRQPSSNMCRRADGSVVTLL